jgi:hypothetical protein
MLLPTIIIILQIIVFVLLLSTFKEELYLSTGLNLIFFALDLVILDHHRILFFWLKNKLS